MYKVHKLIYVEIFMIVYIYTITYIYMKFRKIYMCVYLCRSTPRSHSRYALLIVDCLGFKGLRRGGNGDTSMKKDCSHVVPVWVEFKSIRVFTKSLLLKSFLAKF